jgi:hypothetical protein
VSLFDMLFFYGKELTILLNIIPGLKAFGKQDGRFPEFASSRDQFNRSVIAKALDQAEPVCKNLELNLVIAQIDYIRSMLMKYPCTMEAIGQALEELSHRIEDSLANYMFLYVPFKKTKYFDPNAKPFGDAVQDRFPEMTTDIKEAYLCLGFECYPAAVYHLMLVIDYALIRFTRKLKIKAKDIKNKEWGKILPMVSDAITKLPSRTKKKELFSEVAAHFQHVKDTWRNPAFHNKRKFYQDETEAIFENVKTFVDSLTTIL